MLIEGVHRCYSFWKVFAASVLLILICNQVHAQGFQPNCKVPFSNLEQRRAIDDECSAEGGSSDPTKRVENRAKNNFCAKGSVRDMTFADFLQAQQQMLQIPRRLEDREPLRNLGEGRIARLVAYVKDAHYSDVVAGENVNCNIAGDEANDIHVNLVSSPGDDPCTQVIAEIVPHLRPAVWTPAAINSLSDHLFRFTGQLFYDDAHAHCSGTSRPNPKRASLWEIHPVYAIEVCGTTPADCVAGRSWLPLDQFLLDSEKAATSTVRNNPAVAIILSVDGPRSVLQGQTEEFAVSLQDAAHAAIAAVQDVRVVISGTNVDLDKTNVQIAKGQQRSVTIRATFHSAGIAQIDAQAANATRNVLSASTPITVAPVVVVHNQQLQANPRYNYVPPLRVVLKLYGSDQVFAGEPVKIVGSVVDSQNIPYFTPKGGIDLKFEGLNLDVNPQNFSISIQENSNQGESSISANSPLSQSLCPKPFRLTGVGQPVTGDCLTLNFVSRIRSVIISPEGSQENNIAFGQSEAPIVLELRDLRGNKVGADTDQTVTVAPTPTDIGEPTPKRLVFARGEDTLHATFRAYREGKVHIQVQSLIGLQEFPKDGLELRFLRPWWWFLLFELTALLGGIAGGLLRWYGSTSKPGSFWTTLAVANLIAGITYPAFPVLSGLIPGVVWNTGGKATGAFAWGLVVGVVGAHTLVDRITRAVSG